MQYILFATGLFSGLEGAWTRGDRKHTIQQIQKRADRILVLIVDLVVKKKKILKLGDLLEFVAFGPFRNPSI